MCLEAAEDFAVSEVDLEGLNSGKLDLQDLRIKFPHDFTTFCWDGDQYDADHFDGSLPLVSGHVALWGYHIALFRALARGDIASVAVLVQAGLCVPIEGVIVDKEEMLSYKNKITDGDYKNPTEVIPMKSC